MMILQLATEEMRLCEALRVNSDRADLAQRLAHLLLDRNIPLVAAMERLPGWCIHTDPHAASILPLIFIHIPKTAGSVIRVVLRSLFDEQEWAPLENFDDYAERGRVSAAISAGKRLFLGHMDYDDAQFIATSLGDRIRKMTFLRDPVEHVVSQAAFASLTNSTGPVIEKTGTKRITPHPTYLEDFLGLPFQGAFDVQSQMLCGATQWKMRNEQERAGLVRERIQRLSLFGLYEDLQGSLDLLSYEFALPHIELPELRLNQSGANHAIPEELKETIAKQSVTDSPAVLYARALFRSRMQLAFPAENMTLRRTRIDSNYRARLLGGLAKHWAVELTPDRAWPGTGWGLRGSNIHGQRWRRVSMKARPTILARLHPDSGYLVSFRIHSASNAETHEQLVTTANGCVLECAGRGIVDGMPEITWRMPRDVLARDGAIELAFSSPSSDSSAWLQVAMIRIYPYPL